MSLTAVRSRLPALWTLPRSQARCLVSRSHSHRERFSAVLLPPARQEFRLPSLHRSTALGDGTVRFNSSAAAVAGGTPEDQAVSSRDIVDDRIVHYKEDLDPPLETYTADPLAEYLELHRNEPWMQDPGREARSIARQRAQKERLQAEYNESWILRPGTGPIEAIKKPLRALLFLMEKYGSRNVGVWTLTRLSVEYCLEQAERNEFYHFCGLIPEFHSEMHLATIHIWMLNRRFLEFMTPEEALEWRTAILENFWMFAQSMLSVEGVHDMLLNKRLKAMQQYVMGAIQAYDHTFPMVALGNPSPFMASLWRNLYKNDPMISKAHLLQILRYMLREMDGLQKLEPELLKAGFVNWGPPPQQLPHDINEDEVDIRAYQSAMFTGPVK